ncbi:hypothetical protein GY45DRAFT_1330864 [Cubamyces sp. BRFM 1775]|nr:hypothetical protein GY45DRAFT_1330864 [Cubamyces sp. BRFM 1775]
MKPAKRGTALVDYGSSDDEDKADPQHTADVASKPTSRIIDTAPPPPKKKLKQLPALPDYLAPKVPIDNPALHQGRRRTTPHVEGQFAAYVYIPVLVEKRSKLYKLLLRIFEAAKRKVPILHSIGFPDNLGGLSNTETAKENTNTDVPASEDNGSIELHISLTRPTFLRAHQRNDFKRAVQKAAKSKRKFSASFATLSELTNDERTRTFLTLEVGAGHDELKALSDDLTPILKSIRQKEFYQDPRFHASIAWALLDGSRTETPKLESESAERLPAQQREEPRNSGDLRPAAPSTGDDPFPTIPCFPPSFVQDLREEFVRQLVNSSVSVFEAEEVHVRIGKDVSKWRLQD